MHVSTMIFTGICIVVIMIMDYFGKDKHLAKTWGIAGISFILGLSILGMFIMQSRQTESTLRVVGYANRLFESDLVKWNLTIKKPSSLNGLQQAYSQMSEDITAFKAFLIEKGFTDKEISIQPITSFPTYDNYGEITSYSLNQSVFILSPNINMVESISLNPDFFAKRGMLVQNSNLSYLYTKLPELKKKLLADATSDALARAAEISGSAKVKLGKMKEARAGVFQITEPYSTDVSDSGIYDTSTKSKSISVTITAVFQLK